MSRTRSDSSASSSRSVPQASLKATSREWSREVATRKWKTGRIVWDSWLEYYTSRDGTLWASLGVAGGGAVRIDLPVRDLDTGTSVNPAAQHDIESRASHSVVDRCLYVKLTPQNEGQQSAWSSDLAERQSHFVNPNQCQYFGIEKLLVTFTDHKGSRNYPVINIDTGMNVLPSQQDMIIPDSARKASCKGIVYVALHQSQRPRSRPTPRYQAR